MAVPQVLPELARVVSTLSPHPTTGYHSLTGEPRTPYERAFELVKELCDELYPSLQHRSYVEEGWEPHDSHAPPQRLASAVVPLEQAKMPIIARLLPMTSLYSDLTVFVVDTELEDGYISYSGTNCGDRKTWRPFWPLLDVLIQHRTLLERGVAVFLPTRIEQTYASTSEERTIVHTAPLAQAVPSVSYTPFNAVQSLGASVVSQVLVYERLLLPIFPGATLSDIATIAEKETDAFIIFSAHLRRLLSGLSTAENAEAVAEVVDDLQAGAARLAIEARKVAKGKLLRNAELGMFALTLGAVVATGGAPLPSGVAGVVGTASLLDAIRQFAGHRAETLTLRQSEYFVPYLLRKAASGA